MIAKFVAVMCLFAVARASGWHGAGLGYGSGLGYASGLGYSGYVAPAYAAPIVAKTVVAAPIVTKAVIPAVYAPAVSTVSRYQVHSSPIVKSYVAPVSYAAYSSPYPVAYGHGYSGYGSYGYGGYGHGAKYLW